MNPSEPPGHDAVVTGAVNPFEVPEMPPESTDPLCPWRAPEQKKWYVDVDNTGQAFQEFRERFKALVDSRHLDAQGLLVVVTGESGCGKTSLLHRCADLVDELTNRVSVAGYGAGDFIIDLTRYVYAPDDESEVGNRVLAAAQEVLDRLDKRANVPVEALPPDGAPSIRYRTFYKQLARQAQDFEFTAIILLPEVSDFVRELKEYLFFAQHHARLVFFAESSATDVEEFIDQERARSQIVGLRVHPVNEGDIRMFIKKRLAAHEPGRVAQISDDEALEAEQWIRSIGPVTVQKVVRTLHRAWSQKNAQIPPGDLRAIDILKSYSRYLTLRPTGSVNGGGSGG